MAKSKTVHVIPGSGGWAVKGGGNSGSVHSTKRDAIEHARHLAKSAASGQMVIHNSDARIAEHVTYGLPRVQKPPRKSRLGTKRIEQAVSKIVLDRLESDPLAPGA